MQIRRSAYLGLAALVILGGCATVSPVPPVKTVTVDVPVAVHCNPVTGPDPEYPDSDAALKAAPDLFTRVKLLLEGRLMRAEREHELQVALTACE